MLRALPRHRRLPRPLRRDPKPDSRPSPDPPSKSLRCKRLRRHRAWSKTPAGWSAKWCAGWIACCRSAPN